MPAIAAPTHDLPIVSNENGVKSIYAFHFDLTQEDLGYQLPAPEKGRPEAPYDVHLYADTVELKSHLALPGKNVGIFARKLVLGKSASIDVSGALAKTNFQAGAAADQKDPSYGATGTGGTDGTDGFNSGNVTIFAETAVAGDAAPTSAPGLKNLNMAAAIGAKLQQVIQRQGEQAKTGPFSQPVDWRFDFKHSDCGFMRLKGTVQFAPGQVVGLSGMKVEKCYDNGYGRSFTVVLSSQGLKADLPATIAIEEFDRRQLVGQNPSIPLTTDPFSLQAEVEIRTDDSRWRFAPGAARVAAKITLKAGAKLDSTLDALRMCVANLVGGKLAEDAGGPFAPALQFLAEAACRELNQDLQAGGSPNLVILAQGGAGGRGQDGHAGLGGARGQDGQPWPHVVYADDRWNYIPPKETNGTDGKPGGQGGSAGHSGNGAAGGEISVNVLNWGAASIVLIADAGAGGVPAAPGAPGVGGGGGTATSFTIRKMTRNEIDQGQGNDGKQGPTGPAAAFGGNRGNPGKPGAVKANGAAVEGIAPKTPPAYSYDRLAASLKIEQLLMAQRIARLTYLNAAGDADYQSAALLFLWLCNIAPDSLRESTAFSAEERNARLAMRAAAQVELLRMQRGLDYFGHPYNWAPILTLKHNQNRVTELVVLGKIVEEQFDIYNNNDKSVAEKVGALEKTVAQLSTDLANTDSAATALQKQIEAAQKACRSLENEIGNQVLVMKRHQADIEKAIRRKISDQCNVENVVKVGSAIISVGKGAFNVVDAIKGGKEMADIIKEAKEAAKAIGEAKEAIEKIKKVVANLKSLSEQLSDVDDAIKADKPDSVKIAVVREEFEENLEPLMEQFPEEAKELRGCVRAFLNLTQARNEKVIAYNALLVQKGELKTRSEQLAAEIASVRIVIRDHRQTLIPAVFTTFFRSALSWSKQNLLQLLYEESRAFYYHTGTPRKELIHKLNDLNIAAIADTHARLLTDYDDFLKTAGRPSTDIRDIKVILSKAENPSLFEKLPETGRITFTLDFRHPQFTNYTLVKAKSVSVRLPGVKGRESDVLDVALLMAGEGAVRPLDCKDDGQVVRFNCPPRLISFQYSFDTTRSNPIVQEGLIADKQYAALSPFTTWTLDFGKNSNLNGFVDLAELGTIDLLITGTAFGRPIMKSALARG
jgi:hypothetical protein